MLLSCNREGEGSAAEWQQRLRACRAWCLGDDEVFDLDHLGAGVEIECTVPAPCVGPAALLKCASSGLFCPCPIMLSCCYAMAMLMERGREGR